MAGVDCSADSMTAEFDDSQAPRVVGRYALYGKLAAGGMATVHFGRLIGPVGFSRTVAIKRLHPQFSKDPEFVAMFLDEARIAARIQHPNVVATVDVVAMEEELFLVMDYIRGESFSRLVRQSRKRNIPVELGTLGSIMAGALHGLHAAHEAKDERGVPLEVVHRDVSPQNILVGVDGVARVLDFGVAKAAARVQVTRDGQMKGKLSYMSPEQLAGSGVDRRTDLFAAAIVFWEALTGRRLFEGSDARAVLEMILTAPISLPSLFDPKIPPELDAVVKKGLERDPNVRYQTAREFAIAIENVLPTVPARAVGDWVEAVAGDVLSNREAAVAEIESISSVSEISLNSRDLTSSVSGRFPKPPGSVPSAPGVPAPLQSAPATSPALRRPPRSTGTLPGLPRVPAPPPSMDDDGDAATMIHGGLDDDEAATQIHGGLSDAGDSGDDDLTEVQGGAGAASDARRRPAAGMYRYGERPVPSVAPPPPGGNGALNRWVNQNPSTRFVKLGALGAGFGAAVLGVLLFVTSSPSDAVTPAAATIAEAPAPQATAALKKPEAPTITDISELPKADESEPVAAKKVVTSTNSLPKAEPKAKAKPATPKSAVSPKRTTKKKSTWKPKPKATAATPPPKAEVKPVPPPPPKAASDCDNPTYIDAKGIRRIKTACL